MPYICPAKINLFLEVEGLLPGGCHALSTLMQKIGLCDELEIKPNREGRLSLACDLAPTENSADNLVMKAAELLRTRAGRPDLGADMLLKKRIPWGAGLGGGSSDAAAALSALNELWELGLSSDELREAAAALGSDVAFFLGSPAAWCTGRGEKTEEMSPLEFCLVLIKPPESLSTPLVYRQYDLRERERADSRSFYEAYLAGDKKRVAENLRNALEEPARELFPGLGEYLDALGKFTPCRAMSGSGTAVFGIFGDLASAGAAGAALADKFASATVTVTKTLTRQT